MLYWLYDDEDQNKLEDDNNPFYLNKRIRLPIGIGFTDEHGYLKQSSDHFNKYAKFDKTRHTIQVDYKESSQFSRTYDGLNKRINLLSTTTDPTFNYVPAFSYWLSTYKNHDSADEYSQLTAGYFAPDSVFGFFLYPPDKGPFKTKDLLKLAKMEIPATKKTTATKAAWKGRIKDTLLHSKVQGAIKLHCTLPEWDHRLNKELEKLELFQDLFKRAKAPHLSKIRAIEKLINFTEIGLKFPKKNETSINIENKNQFIKNLKEFKDCIEERIYKPSQTHGDRSFFQHLENVKFQARQLWAILKLPELQEEIKRYFSQLKERTLTNSTEKLLLPPGPYMEEEPGWVHIFDTIARSVTALANSAIAKEFMGNEIWPGIKTLVNDKRLAPYFKSNINIRRTLEDELLAQQFEFLNKEQEKKKEPSPENPGIISTIFIEYNNFVEEFQEKWKPSLDLVTSTPGAPCVLQVVLDCYGNFINKKIAKLDKELAANVIHIKLLVASMRTFGLFQEKPQDLTDAVINALAKPSGQGCINMGKGRKLISRFFYPSEKDGSDLLYGSANKTAQKAYKTFMTLMNFTINMQNVLSLTDKSDEEIFKATLKLVNTYGSLSLSVLAGIKLADSFIKPSSNKIRGEAIELLSEGSDKLAVGLGIISATLAYMDAEELWEKGEKSKAAFKYFESAGSFAANIGYILKTVTKCFVKAGTWEAEVLSTSWIPFVGQVLLVIGSFITTILFVKDMAELVWNLWYKYESYGPAYRITEILWDKITEQIKPGEITPQDRYLIDLNPYKAYKTYTSKDQAHPEITHNPAKECEDLKESFLPRVDANGNGDFLNWGVRKSNYLYNLIDKGIIWEKLHWRSVVPLSNEEYEPEIINEIVELPKPPDGARGKIKNVTDIINYYREAKTIYYNEVKKVSARMAENKISKAEEEQIESLNKIPSQFEQGSFNPKGVEGWENFV
ncbi:MAG: hypothetical protein GY710_05640 [Desulfobacteraceae bacterium]|nr:hypothetical protein [Desulfobacteraceae bacterium]